MDISAKDKEKKRKGTIRVDEPTSALDAKKQKSNPNVKCSVSKKAVFYAETEEVDEREAQDDLNEHHGACDEIRAAFEQICKLKKSEAISADVESVRVQSTLNFITLKKLNRLAHIRCKKARDATHEAKQKIDQYHLQLQNLLYETTHLQKEINKCLEFKSKDEEVELVPLEQFYEEAPKDISQPDVTKKNEHKQTLARLDWELEQRKRLARQLKGSQKKKEQMEHLIKVKREQLESLQPKLNAILESTKPVQDYLDMPFDKTRQQHQLATYLPNPLYVLYMQLSAYREACDKEMAVSIEGEMEAAQAFEPTTIDFDDESDSDQEEQDKQDSKRRRKTVEERQTSRVDYLLRRHPLSVHLTVSGQGTASLCLSFFYISVLHIVTVKVKVVTGKGEMISSSISGSDLMSDESILTDLYPGDDGKSSPNSANEFELSKMGVSSLSDHMMEIGKPYMWSQWLSGLQFLGTSSSPVKAHNSISSIHMQETIDRLRLRLHCRLSLLRQLSNLESNNVIVSPEYQSLFPTKIISKLTAWKRSTFEDFTGLPYTEEAVESQIVNQTDMYFTAQIERASAKLTCHVVLKPDYPTTPPYMLVSVHWKTYRSALNDAAIKALEAELNIYLSGITQKKSADQILTNQLQRLLMCFDVYLETEAGESSIEGPAEISQEKMFTKTARGPERSKPYVYDSQRTMFVHRR